MTDTTALPTSIPSSSTTSPLPSPSLSLARLAFVSHSELEAALVRERDAAVEIRLGVVGEKKTAEGEEEREEWRAAVGPKSGRKIGKILRKSVDLRLEMVTLDTLTLKGDSLITPSTPTKPLPSPRGTGSPGFKLFSTLLRKS